MIGIRHLFRTHWTYDTLTGGLFITSGYFFLKDAHGYPAIQKLTITHTDLPNAIDDDLMIAIDNELFAITKDRLYADANTNFKIMVSDNIESKTHGCFQHRYNALLRFSSRLVLNNVEQIRKNYPNFFRLFKENGLDKLDALDSSTLTDSDLKTILLTKNAKKFVIARELIYASSSKFLLPLFVSIVAFMPGFALCYYLRSQKHNDWLAFIPSLIISILLLYLSEKMYYRDETFDLDFEAAKIDEDHKNGCIDYLKSSIELCKLLNKLTNGKANFDENGNYLGHSATYVDRLERIKLDNKIRI
uniref:Uncharacterized protein n=1 Tax=Meloidogyne enterolobii TaxID=390850 RepID=A0A6V7W8G3_MELEN|nr:unnamed protein product [Meloidogyne enterolobii]